MFINGHGHTRPHLEGDGAEWMQRLQQNQGSWAAASRKLGSRSGSGA
jgi:hypothetical protein